MEKFYDELIDNAQNYEKNELLNLFTESERTQIIKTFEKSNSFKPVDPVNSIDLVDPVNSIDLVDPVNSIDLDEPADSVNSVDSVDLVDPVNSIDLVNSVDSVDLDEPVDLIDSVDLDEPVDSVDMSNKMDIDFEVNKNFWRVSRSLIKKNVKNVSFPRKLAPKPEGELFVNYKNVYNPEIRKFDYSEMITWEGPNAGYIISNITKLSLNVQYYNKIPDIPNLEKLLLTSSFIALHKRDIEYLPKLKSLHLFNVYCVVNAPNLRFLELSITSNIFTNWKSITDIFIKYLIHCPNLSSIKIIYNIKNDEIYKGLLQFISLTDINHLRFSGKYISYPNIIRYIGSKRPQMVTYENTTGIKDKCFYLYPSTSIFIQSSLCRYIYVNEKTTAIYMNDELNCRYLIGAENVILFYYRRTKDLTNTELFEILKMIATLDNVVYMYVDIHKKSFELKGIFPKLKVLILNGEDNARREVQTKIPFYYKDYYMRPQDFLEYCKEKEKELNNIVNN